MSFIDLYESVSVDRFHRSMLVLADLSKRELS